jgi:hypothetical protein
MSGPAHRIVRSAGDTDIPKAQASPRHRQVQGTGNLVLQPHWSGFQFLGNSRRNAAGSQMSKRIP